MMILVPLHPHRVYPHYFWIPSIYEFASLLKSANPHFLWHVLGQGGRSQPLDTHVPRWAWSRRCSALTVSECPSRCLFPATSLALQGLFLMILFKMVTKSSAECRSVSPTAGSPWRALWRKIRVWDELQCHQLFEFSGHVSMVLY